MAPGSEPVDHRALHDLADRGEDRSGFCAGCKADMDAYEAERVRAQTRARVAAHRAKAKEDAA